MSLFQKGDIVQVNPEKYPELAWSYFIIDDVIKSTVDSIDITGYALRAKSIGEKKKAKKRTKLLNEVTEDKLFHSNDLIIMVRNNSEKVFDL